MTSTWSCGPFSASIAARCEMLDTFEERCDWRLPAALMASTGPTIHPRRHPVIAYVLATPLTRMVRSVSSGTASTIDTARTPSYTRFW